MLNLALRLFIITLFFTPFHLEAHTPPNDKEEDIQSNYSIHIQPTTETIQLDGRLEEACWNTCQIAENFWQKWPRDDARAQQNTQVRLTYDDDNIYVAAICYEQDNYVLQTLKRDVDYWRSDAFSIILDPVNETTFGFIFGVTAAGVQMEGILQQQQGVSEEWDTKWFVETHQYDNYWSLEMAIPFKSLRYEMDNKKWGVNFIRNHMQANQYHTWTPVPLQMRGVDLGFTGALLWENVPQPESGNISIIPYITGSAVADYEEEIPTEYKANAGLDAKIAVTSSLNLDLTVNPDFSQVEVDRQVTNLTRFNLFFPERRNFFLENSDIFAGFGIPQTVRPFFSRKIGVSDEGENVPIYYGARLSGSLDNNWRVGIMNLQTGRKDDFAAQNYSAVAFERKLFQRSTIKGIFLNRQTFDKEVDPSDEYGRNAGLEFNYRSNNSKWESWASFHQSFKPTIKTDNRYYGVGTAYTGRNLQTLFDFSKMGTDYYADMGIINRIENYDAELDTTFRLGFIQLFNASNYKILPEDSKINEHNFNLETYIVLNPDGTLNERFNQLAYRMMFKDRTGLRFAVNNRQVNLLFPFSFTDETPLPRQPYNFTSYSAFFSSDSRRKISADASLTFGDFYNGTRQSYGIGAKYRQQPWGNFGLSMDYNKLDFPEPYGNAEFLLFNSQVEIGFSKNIFWTTFLQYNTQADNFNINSRLQWRFKPLSDLFVVYTDNYAVNTFGKKNRSLVFKLNYWLTI